jgi:hypothetical protein
VNFAHGYRIFLRRHVNIPPLIVRFPLALLFPAAWEDSQIISKKLTFGLL